MRPFYYLLAILLTTNAFAQTFQNTPPNRQIANRGTVVPITATIAYQGYDETQAYFGQGEYEIFADLQAGTLDKPVIVLDGFDPGDSRDIAGLYNSLSFGGDNIADIVRDEGFDVVILNAPQYTTDGKFIDGGSDYIQRNAMVLVETIQQINDQKVGNEELVILGPSMGGLIARYALAYMEENNIEHETRLYISFDSPHLGANIPISLQYLINYLAVQTGDPLAQALIDDVLGSPAAKEMLIDHLEAHLLAGSEFEQDPTKLLPEGAPDFRDAFQGELNALGFPSNVRNVAMINGAGDGTGTGSPGLEVINTTLDLDVVTSADVALYFTPEASQSLTVVSFDTFLVGVPVASFSADSESRAVSDGVDSAPGGTSNISNALSGGGGNQVIIDFVNALQQDEYCFIPTISALAIDTEENWFASPDLNDSPFVATYIPLQNESHVQVTQESADFALDEIRNGALAIDEVALDMAYILERNPVDAQIVLKRNRTVSGTDVEVSITSLSGQVLLEQSFETALDELRIAHSLASGLYFITIQNGQASNTIKFVVK